MPTQLPFPYACRHGQAGFIITAAEHMVVQRRIFAFFDGFARGLWALADVSACPLIGGDTTQGPLNLCITVFGEAPAGAGLREELRGHRRRGEHDRLDLAVGDVERLGLTEDELTNEFPNVRVIRAPDHKEK